MNQTIIIIIAVVFGGSFLMMIPIMISQRNRKKREQSFTADNVSKALLHVYGQGVKIDGKPIKQLDTIRGEQLQPIVALEPGTHSFEGTFSSSEPTLSGNKNFKTKKLAFDLALEAGHTYTVSIYSYSPEERHSYYEGDVGEAVFSMKLDVYGGAYPNAYIICYKEG